MAARSIDNTGRLLIACGLSGSGKSTLVRHALASLPDDLQYMRTFTTRPRRRGEDDTEYTFISGAEYFSIKSQSELWDESEIYGNYYGVNPISYIKGLAEGRHFIVCSTPDDAIVAPMRTLYGDAIRTIHIQTDQEVSAERLTKRGIQAEIARIAIDASRLAAIFKADFSFAPTGHLLQDKAAFMELVRRIIYE